MFELHKGALRIIFEDFFTVKISFQNNQTGVLFFINKKKKKPGKPFKCAII